MKQKYEIKKEENDNFKKYKRALSEHSMFKMLLILKVVYDYKTDNVAVMLSISAIYCLYFKYFYCSKEPHCFFHYTIFPVTYLFCTG